MAESKSTEKLTGIDAARGVAATVVVLYHSARHLDKNYGVPELMKVFQFGHAGVDLFFVISGFIILFIHYGDIGQPGCVGYYVRRRLTRIIPTYWVALSLTILISLLAGHAFPGAFNVAWSAALLPSHNEPLLGIAWTLQYEIVFYAIFCLWILNRWVGFAVLTLWLAWIVLGKLRGGISGEIPGSLYGMYNLEFFLGMGAAYWFRNHTLSAPRLMLAAGTTFFIAVGVTENFQLINGYADLSRLIYGPAAAMIVLGAAEADRQNLISIPMILRTLGQASYSIYLFQFVFIGLTWRLWLAAGLDERMPHFASFPLLATAGVLGGIAASRLIEYPLMDFIRHRVALSSRRLSPVKSDK